MGGDDPDITGEEPGDRAVVVRYGEIFLKSEPVRRQFIGRLTRNLYHALDSAGVSVRITTPRGRVIIWGRDTTLIAGIAAEVFGVVDAAPCLVSSHQIDAIKSAAVVLTAPLLGPGTSFAVRARRETTEGPSSQDLAATLGSYIQATYPGCRVDLTRPEVVVTVESRKTGVLVSVDKVKGPGGLPLGTQGGLLALLSAGIDSPVASWMMMRRGCRMTHLFIDGGRFAGTGVMDGALENHRRLSAWCRGVPLHMVVVSGVPFYEAAERSRSTRLTCVLCKRFMVRVASVLLPHTGAAALVTGESLGQVASQTLGNIRVISMATTVPVLRPLIGTDKREIVDLARSIGTFRHGKGDEGPQTLCCHAVPRYPATDAKVHEVEAAETRSGIDAVIAATLRSVLVVTAQDGVVLFSSIVPVSALLSHLARLSEREGLSPGPVS
jgi:thiamine biosynthesis protein ThiI